MQAPPSTTTTPTASPPMASAGASAGASGVAPSGAVGGARSATSGAHPAAGSHAASASHAVSHDVVSYLPLHRVEALTDGIFAVAMTLLVIELKLPAGHAIHSAPELYESLADLAIKGIAWINSFFILSLFWIGHHRAFSHLRMVDGRLVLLNLVELAFVSLMPFVSMIEGEFGTYLVSQIIYSANMAFLSVLAMAVAHHIHRHPELCLHPMSLGRYLAVRLRLGGLIVISLVAILIASLIPWPAIGNVAFSLMWVIGLMSRRLQQRTDAKALPAAPV